MTSREPENLSTTGKLKVEPGEQNEFEGLLPSARLPGAAILVIVATGAGDLVPGFIIR